MTRIAHLICGEGLGHSHMHRWPVDMTDRIKLNLVLFVALFQGLLYLLLLPPWQHYDEPTHFEYAWLIVQRSRLPSTEDIDPIMRREVAASMLQHNFYWNLPKPDLMNDDHPIPIGYAELGHAPAYYVLVSLPLRLVRYLDITTQLYVARSVSLVLFLLTVMVAAGLVRDLTPPGHLLRWAAPLMLVLMPPFVDVMTAVNNDVGAVFVFSLFLWGSVRAICFGLSWRRAFWLVAAVLLAVLTKTTASMALVLVPLVVLIAFWIQRGWRWRWLMLSIVGICTLVLVAVFEWGDAAYWYRPASAPTQDPATRASDARAPLGSHTVILEVTPEEQNRYLANPLLAQDVLRLTGKRATVGGWVWANQPATVGGPGLLVGQWPQGSLNTITRPITVTTVPTFVAWTFTVPAETKAVQYALFGKPTERITQPLRILLDGAFLVVGEYPTNTMPVFDDATANSGIWAGQRFTNLLRNPSGEQGWPRLRLWFEGAVVPFLPRSPSQVLAALFDIERTGPVLLQSIFPFVLDGFFTRFAWGHIALTGIPWLFLFRGLALVALVGCAKWVIWSKVRSSRASVRPVLVFLGLAGALVWGNTIIWPLPMLWTEVWFPAARYAFPAMIPTVLMLVGGWCALWPRSYRAYGSFVLLLYMIGLNVVSVWTIWIFYRSLPIT